MRGRSPSPYDRRRSPPGRRDRRFPNPRDRRRQRSYSPGPERGRRSPAYKRFRRDDEYYDRYDRGGSPGYRRSYDRDRYDDRDFRDPYRDPHGRGPHRRDEPQTYKEFIMQLPDEVTPADASQKYQEYLANWYGSRTKAEFEQRKEEEWMREKYDPREMVKAIDRRKERAKEASSALLEKIKNGDLKPSAVEFNQGAGVVENPEKLATEGEEGAQADDHTDQKGDGDRPQFFAPAVCWTTERMESDLKLSIELVKKLDTEKEITWNTLVDQSSSPEDAAPGAAADAEQNDNLTANKAGDGEESEPGPVTEEQKQDVAGESVDKKQESETEEKLEASEGNEKPGFSTEEKLDLLLTYLWEIHLIDYYAGLELTEAEFESTKCRMLRPSRPATNETADKETDKRMLEELDERVDKFWKARLSNDGPWEAKAQKRRVELAVEDFVDSQVTRIDNKKWGNKLSGKLFVGKEFVIKHIRLKHATVVDAETEKILDEIYFENYKKEKEEEEQRLMEERRKSEALHEGIEPGFEGFNEMYGHGPRGMGMSAARGMAGRGMMGPMLPSPMMGGPMGQVLLPAPGAGPLGPFILQPVPSGGMSPMDMGGMGMEGPRSVGQVGMAGRGGGNVRGRPWGGAGFRDYYDLDAPQNNRAVLDYGDL